MVKECKKEVLRRPKWKTLTLKERKTGFATVESSLLKQRAIQEAQRCLSLRECESCEICSLFLPRSLHYAG